MSSASTASRIAGSTGSTRTRSSRSTARSSSSGRTTSARSSTTGRDGSARTRSSAATRRSRPARSTPRGAGLDLPELPRLGDRPAPRPARGDDPPVVARPPLRLVEPRGGQRRVDLRADRDAGPACGGPRLGTAAQGIGRRRGHAVRRRRDLRGRVPRGREHRRRHEGAARPALQQQPVGDLHPLSAQTAAVRLADKAIGYGMPALRVDGHDVLAVYEAMRRASPARAPGRGRRSSRRSPTARPRTRPPTTRACTSTRSASPRSSGSATASRRYEAYLERLGVLDDARPPSRRRRSR